MDKKDIDFVDLADVPKVSTLDLKEKADIIQDPKFRKIKYIEDIDFVEKAYQKALDKERGFVDRAKNFLAGQTKLSRGLGTVLDFATVFLPYGQKINDAREMIALVVGRKQKQKQRPMIKKILSLKNFVNVRDENGKIDPKEIAASVIQLAITGAVVWGLVELGIFNEFMEFMNAGN